MMKDARNGALKTALTRGLETAGEELVKKGTEMEGKGWLSFTGNTITSYAYGLYADGAILKEVTAKNAFGLKSIVRGKVPKGKWVFLEKPYTGNARGVTGSSKIVYPTGEELSHATIKSGRKNEMFCLRITTGTEYSGFLEATGRYVLSPVKAAAKKIVNAALSANKV